MKEPYSALARVVDAIAFAADAHRNQRRKDEALTPYINHPVALVRVLHRRFPLLVLEQCAADPSHGLRAVTQGL
jgi:(p)ppGpp synthase/HD superfamily hydrolase